MCVCDVQHVGEVEEVCVVAELETSFVVALDVDYGREELYVAFAEDAGWTQGAG